MAGRVLGSETGIEGVWGCAAGHGHRLGVGLMPPRPPPPPPTEPGLREVPGLASVRFKAKNAGRDRGFATSVFICASVLPGIKRTFCFCSGGIS